MKSKRIPGNPADIRNVPVGRLDTLSAVRDELARLYRAGRRGEMPASDASRLAHVLSIVRQLILDIASGDLHSRLEALERRLNERPESIPAAPDYGEPASLPRDDGSSSSCH